MCAKISAEVKSVMRVSGVTLTKPQSNVSNAPKCRFFYYHYYYCYYFMMVPYLFSCLVDVVIFWQGSGTVET